jgi:hypothetical protein
VTAKRHESFRSSGILNKYAPQSCGKQDELGKAEKVSSAGGSTYLPGDMYLTHPYATSSGQLPKPMRKKTE